MSLSDLRESSKAIQKEIFSLHPSTLITMFEIDLTDLITARNTTDPNPIFRFHNQVKMLNGSNIFWSGPDGATQKTYWAAPIQATDFEYNAKGTPPAPKLSITANEESIQFLNVLKERMLDYGDLVGAKVSRIRTFLKFLDKENFGTKGNPDADPTKEFPRDVFYIDRKVVENKFIIEFELGSILDVEGLMLPQRMVLSRCVAEYRGCGCCYEYAKNRTSVHENASLPMFAPPVATATDESIAKIIGKTLSEKGKHVRGQPYQKGDFVYLERDGIKYYYVSKIDNNTSTPPNSEFWVAEACSKLLKGCKLRWQPDDVSLDVSQYGWLRRGTLEIGTLPFVGFPSVNKYGFNLY